MKFSTRYYLSLVLIDEGTFTWLHGPMMYPFLSHCTSDLNALLATCVSQNACTGA